MTPAVITDDQRRARLGARHLLAAPAATPEEVADAVVALHATDPATVFLSAFARLAEPSVAAVETALYEDRSLVRLLAMRRTMFVVTAKSAPVVDAAAARPIAVRERARLLEHLADGVGWDEARLAEVERAVLAAVRARGEATAVELGREVPALLERVAVAGGTAQNVASRVLRVLAADGWISRSRPRGTWTSSQYRWAPSTPWPELDAARARAELVRRWLAACGPGTEADLKWWTGWSLGAVRAALAAVDAVAVPLEGGVGHVLPDDLADVPAPAPWVALLPALDPTPMGWRDRDWYLPAALRPALFDRSGNVGPTVWADGAVVGGWAQRADGRIAWRPLVDLGAGTRAAVDRAAERLGDLLAGARVVPRFRTPLEKELVK
ncbi:winged helix DNA-binding domain-containing protein [Saccharothrix australiensis]|uniref:Winged helix DNA-binding protein n=1 Tax=Saccharothrix australiensis TaxID=2072 RepID=A0A495W037_9PSEU|nr:winged helix DNA-binding domain-containing protein [Saccharothrix australiensis]RKT55061.1 winged helix DNA-binding protein [Saccharothrix australiensis]